MKWLWLLGALTVAPLVSTPAVAAEKPIPLRMAFQNSETSWGAVNALKPWVAQVEKATNGRVKIEVYYSQSLAKGKDTWAAVKDGIADLGWCFHGYWPGMTPLSDAVSLPALPFASAEAGSEAFWRLYENFPAIHNEFSPNKVLALFISTPYTLISAKKKIEKLEDLQGMKIRATGGPPTVQLQSFGGVPVLIPMPDTYVSLQKGVIDGMEAPWEAIHGFRLYEVVSHYTEAPLPATYFSLVMNKKKWDQLPQDVQTAIMSVSGVEGSRFWGANFFDSAKQAVLAEAKKAGNPISVYNLPEKERERWIEVGGKPIWKEWVGEMEKKGHAEAPQILDYLVDHSGK
ncbi:MAG: TRAP transporter substrate-binding protein [Desulfuromonadales bacterium]|nr:TRAP transporter substrate-binding protein [Desulfuromonadales bacterium]